VDRFYRNKNLSNYGSWVKAKLLENIPVTKLKKIFRLCQCFCLIIYLHACSSSIEIDRGPSSGSVDVSSIPNAIPKDEPKSKFGNPNSYVVSGDRYYVLENNNGFVQRGIASWYGKKFHGRRTSSGETYDMYAMTAAHKTLPLPTYLEVTNMKNGEKIIVKANDRGPFHKNRILDLSYAAATKLDIVKDGTGLVEIKAINPRSYYARRNSAAPVHTVLAENNSFGFYIQAGSFANRINANKLRDRLGILGESLLSISEASINGSNLYRVRIGPILNIDVADNIVAKLNQLGINDHHIVID